MSPQGMVSSVVRRGEERKSSAFVSFAKKLYSKFNFTASKQRNFILFHDESRQLRFSLQLRDNSR